MNFGNPFLPSKFDIYKAAIVMEEDWRKIAKKKMFLVTSEAERMILQRAATIQCNYYRVYMLDDNIYFTKLIYPPDYAFLDVVYHYQISCMEHIANSEIEALRKKLNHLYDTLRGLGDYYHSIDDYYKTIDDRIAKAMPRFPQFNPLKFRKACRKMGGQFVTDTLFDKPIYGFKLSKVTTGNAVEGTVKYKSITTYFNSSLDIVKFIYEFNKVLYDSSWNIPGVNYLHPHTRNNGDTGFCWGNRATDFTLYRNSMAYEFMLALVKESLNSYNPESPYINVRKLAGVVGMLEKKAEGLKAGDPTLHYPVPIEGELANSLVCGICGHTKVIMGELYVCGNELCMANPIAHITCDECDNRMIRGEWQEDIGAYNWNCSNLTCPRCPDYQPITSDKPHCVECGSLCFPLANSDKFHCEYGTCTTIKQWQEVPDTDHYEYIAHGVTYRSIEEAKEYFHDRWGNLPTEIPADILKELKCPVCGERVQLIRLVATSEIVMRCSNSMNFGASVSCPMYYLQADLGIYKASTNEVEWKKLPTEYMEYFAVVREILPLYSRYIDAGGNSDDIPHCESCDDGYAFIPVSPYLPPFCTSCCEDNYDWDTVREALPSSDTKLRELLGTAQDMAEENNLSRDNFINILRGGTTNG